MRPDEYRRFCIRLCLAQALLFASVASAADTADTIFLGRDILTMRGPRPEHTEAIAVRGGMILYVGPAAAARAR